MSMNKPCRLVNELMALSLGGAVLLFGLQHVLPAGVATAKTPGAAKTATAAKDDESLQLEPTFSKASLSIKLAPVHETAS